MRIILLMNFVNSTKANGNKENAATISHWDNVKSVSLKKASSFGIKTIAAKINPDNTMAPNNYQLTCSPRANADSVLERWLSAWNS